MEERVTSWAKIEDFPRYEISAMNEVRDIIKGDIVPKAEFNGVEYVELFRDDKPYLMHVNRMRWAAFYLPGFPPSRTDFERHGEWLKNEERYSDGERSHLCGLVCSVGEV
jgi:hypothetical protein